MQLIKSIKKWLEPCPKVFPQDSSWVFDDTGNINWKNVKHCQEFIDLKNVGHSKKWHKEGNPLKHTQLVVKEIQKIFKKKGWYIHKEDKKILLLAALCHDLGKATTTYWDETEKDYKCKSHGEAGEKITRKLLYNEPIKLREEVCWLVRWHMTFHQILYKTHKKQVEIIKNLSQGNSTIEKLAYLNLADSRGSKSDEFDDSMDKFNTVTRLAYNNSCLRTPYQKNTERDSFTMYMMIGLPGSGKDTYIYKFLRDCPVICRDDIREEIKDGHVVGRKLYLSNGEEQIVTNMVNQRIKNCCERKVSFVINQTSLKKKYRQELIAEVQKYANPKIVYVYIEAPSIETCIERRGGGKWEGIINRMNNNFEFPDKSEYDEIVIIKQPV